jgi:hypothetical protein
LLGCATTDPGPHCAEMIPSNVEPSSWMEGAEDVTIEASNAAYSTSTCGALDGAHTTVVSQPSGPELCVVSTARFEVRAGARLTVTGTRPLVVMATDEARIDGVIDVSAEGARSGPGGFDGGNATVIDGSGPAGGIAGQHVGSYQDAGGGGGGLCGRGGRGGDSPGGVFGTTALGGEGGGTVAASWELEPLFGGSGGGRGRGTVDASGASGGFGGAGGGAIQISSQTRVRIGGQILAGGGGGMRGLNRPGDDNQGSGGGAGSGGSVLLEAPEVRFETGGHVVITGGGGGSGVVSGLEGADGQDGRLAPMGRPAGGASRSVPAGWYSDGGDGAGGDALDGAAGVASATDGNGGGGGAGSGCALFRALGGTLTGSASASPGAAPAVRVLPVRIR